MLRPPTPLESQMMLLGCGGSGGGASFVGPLDAYTANLAGAWSVARRLLGSYTGSLIRIRRSSDNTEQDIGATVLGDLDTATIATFVGANSAYVTTVYHQNGGSNLTQTTAASQPRIVNAGTVDMIGSVPAMFFDGSNDYLTCDPQNLDRLGYYAACRVGVAPNLYAGVFSQPAGATWSGDYSRACLYANLPTVEWQVAVESISYSDLIGSYTSNVNRLLELHNATDCGGVQNGTEYPTLGAPATVTNSTEDFIVGNFHPTGGVSGSLMGYLGELISWNLELNTAARLARRNVVNDYWSLY